MLAASRATGADSVVPLSISRLHRRAVALVALCTGSAATRGQAQTAGMTGPIGSTLSVDVARSWNARSVQPREPLDAALSSVTVQLTHPLGYRAGLTWRYVLEATPLLALRVGASAARLQQIGPGLRDLYTVRHTVGAGVAPLGVQADRPLGARTHAALDLTGGGVRFTRVVPYGDDGTRTNFTFTARLLIERRQPSGRAWAAGYALYHVSNGGFGRANPGINANLMFLRLTHHRSAP